MTFDDSSPAQCRQEDIRLGRIEEEHSLVVGDPHASQDDELKREINAQYLAMRCHHQTCQWLRVNSERVTPLDLTRAALTEDPAVQLSRLRQLFGMCGVSEEHLETEREDLVRIMADYGPQSDQERVTLYQKKAAEQLAAKSAIAAMGPGTLPQVTTMHASNFGKLSKVAVDLGDRLDAMRGNVGPSTREVSMGVALFATARSPITPTQQDAVSLARRASVAPAICQSPEHLDGSDRTSARPSGWDLL
jgi:hypothetical protein